MVETQIFYTNLAEIVSKLGCEDIKLKKLLLKSLGYENVSNGEATRWIEGVDLLIDKSSLETSASQIAFNMLPKALNMPAFSQFAEWSDDIYFELAEAIKNLGGNEKLIGYLKMIYYGRRVDKTDLGVDVYINNESANRLASDQFNDIPHHTFLSLDEAMDLNNLLEEFQIDNIDNDELKEFVSEELKPALEKAKELGKGMLVTAE
ncbi:MAG: hypothetical protein A3D24_03740 [Candidatus Blackburnbacteria bacterium RIFCSPHIGHO2_02_FULL_39_13]|uniref:Uncharacterized protein n=1 Tax=Candidatus Blackburnbacteria bacterium RIFCSPLOWO2_01_FULL_40_20 TaxID=1797519 RepID=A0A1G1VDJ2_9BACT|nr:MAG: hypothetical protein UT38_C0011G0035 [Microgenomates group bacterium GW2011_GWA2_39_19]OGY06992.1 MAG: hypothetical protein A2694_03705 [Candidatus Blackburnbacteria bacterium RIFCSPHIGHO2_01_FULL_40_17]OGY08505.1 MAG: hypothetical protein A3D24_03740 [Candidatus Blackburnbacteria bacterium RIFCSPHIGHO2_02_FULL_39_13]OGY13272.1 MAG: hypothetical protein A3A77_02475 [Candidatus Blackburnbacteria bacterium RIFCSPLOWO2_01_FULL_40_20]OGY15595.1 MAG: hypothetical protein A3I52_00790 [Candida